MKFGEVYGMSYSTKTRVMALAPFPKSEVFIRRKEVWSGLVVADDHDMEFSWPIGSIVTLSPDDEGLTLIDDMEGA